MHSTQQQAQKSGHSAATLTNSAKAHSQSQTASTHGSTAMTTASTSVGRGASQTTISAPQTQITAGNKVVIQGTVMDLSAGTTQAQQTADFPAGVPVASDASMKDWMAYVYQQKPAPTNFTGVTVTLMAIDPNGNYVTLGTSTTDANGIYHLTWDHTISSRRLYSLRSLRRHKRLLGIKRQQLTW